MVPGTYAGYQVPKLYLMARLVCSAQGLYQYYIGMEKVEIKSTTLVYQVLYFFVPTLKRMYDVTVKLKLNSKNS